MGLRINTNVQSIAAQRHLGNTRERLNSNMNKLASGERITRAADDAAGLAISENLKAQIRSIRQAKRNGDDGISLVQTAEGGLSEISNMVIRLRELSMQAATDTLGDKERSFTDIEFQQLKDEIQRIAVSSEFNGRKLLDGTGGLAEFQIGTRNDPNNDRVRYDGSSLVATLAGLGIGEESVSTKQAAQVSLSSLDEALVTINSHRANLGAIQNRLTSVVQNLGVTEENYSQANSRIRDVDVAAESAKLTKNQILSQAGVSVLSQANQVPNLALSLLNG